MITSNPAVIRVHQAYRQALAREMAMNVKALPPVEMKGLGVRQGDERPKEPRVYRSGGPRPEFRGPAPKTDRMYSMQDQAADAPLWVVECRASGQALGRVRGSAAWALGQMQILAGSLACRVDGLFARKG